MKLDIGEILKDLEAEVEEKRLALEEAKAALSFLRKKYHIPVASESVKRTPVQVGHPPKSQKPVVESAGVINLSTLDVPESKLPLSDIISDVIRQFGQQEFTVGHVFTVLQQRGEVPDVKAPKASIAQSLAVLEKRGEVARTFKGVGNIPHRFVVVTNSPTADEVREAIEESLNSTSEDGGSDKNEGGNGFDFK